MMNGSDSERLGLVAEPHSRILEAFAGKLRSDVPAARASFGRAVESLMGHRADTADHIEATLAADPAMAAAHLLRGFALRVLGRRDLLPGIGAALESAKATFQERGAEPREQALYDALSLWTQGAAPRAAERLDRHLAFDPCDLLTIKLMHSLRFMIGDNKGKRQSVESVLPSFEESSPGFGFVLGCHAFALEETGELEAAERAGHRALELEAKDVWALHAIAHVLYEENRPREGVSWLAEREALLEGVNNFAGHLAWHEALFHVDSGCPSSALDLYDRRIAIYPPRDYRDVSNATSLLLLLEGRGFDLVSRWFALAEIARERLGDHGLAFADIHYVLALASAGHLDESRLFIASMRRAVTQRADEFDARVSLDVGIPIAEAVIESRAGHHSRAREIVDLVARDVERIGGSHAQRRVIDWLFRTKREQPRFSSMKAGA